MGFCRKGFLCTITFIASCLSLIISCVDPIEPVFQEREGLIYVDAFVSTTPETSFARISESVFFGSNLKFELVSSAAVSFRNVDTGETIVLVEDEDSYVPPDDFVGAIGDSWELDVVLPDGRRYRSTPETITDTVGIADINATYNPDFVFKENINDFVPGHSVSVDIRDPADEENYYFWKFKSFESLKLCRTCTNSVLRGGKCVDNPFVPIGRDYKFDYICEDDCWRIRYNESIKLFSDEFTNGNQINALPVGDVLLYSKENIVVEIQQYSLSAEAYDYYKILKDLVDNNSGLNSPPPAALIGNVFNPTNEDEFVLGRFTAAASTTLSIFIERTEINESPIDPFQSFRGEQCPSVCPLETCSIDYSGPACPVIQKTDCIESKYQTAIKPEKWIDISL